MTEDEVHATIEAIRRSFAMQGPVSEDVLGTLLDEVIEAVFRKGAERGFIGAKAAVEAIRVEEQFDPHSVIWRIGNWRDGLLSQNRRLSDLYFKPTVHTGIVHPEA